MTLRELRLMVAVAQAGSILRAAEEVGLTQPAVSRAIADLEGAVGVRLFDRTNRGVEETPQGRILIDRARAMFAEMRQGIEEINALSDATAGEVRIGGTPAMCGGLLAHAIARVAAQRPGVRHVVEEMEAERLAAAIRARVLDLAIGREPGVRADAEVAFEHLFDDRMFVVAGHRHPIAARARVSAAQLADLRWLLPPPETQTHRQVGDALRRLGVRLPQSAVTIMSVLMRYQLVRTGAYVTALHGSALHHAMLPGIRVLPIELDATIPIGMSRLKGRTTTPAVEAFATVIREVAKPLRNLSV
ncbi:MAG: LysR family transcriptional regulator, partial [Burkholderiales bacterium]|nr:LysR family transcriptional regulator [Burkholderiales bacterium]